MMTEPTVSIIVIVYNGERTLEDCLQSLMDIEFPRHRLEIIVVDNASTDSTPGIIKQFPVHYVLESRKGRAVARNTGARQARGSIIAFTDADCVVDRMWLTRLVEALENDEEAGATAGPLLSEPRNHVERYIEYRGIMDQEKMMAGGPPFSLPFAMTSNIAIRSQAFKSAGGFDGEKIPIAGEDADFCWRMLWKKYTLRYVPDALVWHRHRSDLKELFHQTMGYGFGNASLFAKHHARFNRKIWIDHRFYVWFIKALLKTPWSLLTEKDPFKRRIPWYDTVANLGIIIGKIHGSLYYKRLVL